MKQANLQFASYVRYLFFITAFTLVILAAGSFIRVNENPEFAAAYIVYTVLMFGNAIAMLVCGLYIDAKLKPVFWFAVILLSLNIILTIFDQFGLVDLLFSLLNLATLTVLLIFRKEFLPHETND